MKIGTYSLPTEIYGKKVDRGIGIKNNKYVVSYYEDPRIEVYNRNITSQNEGNYTIITVDQSDYTQTLFCLTSDCKYICDIDEYNNDWDYNKPCFLRIYNLYAYLNSVYNDLYKKILIFMDNTDNERKALSKEKKNSDKEIKANKGYYYEEFEKAEYDTAGYYNGYFLIDNQLTVIKQSGKRQSDVIQSKIVLKLNPETSITIINIV